MARKSLTRKKRASNARKTTPQLPGFFRALFCSALVSFGVASLWLNPQWRDQVDSGALLSQFGLPSLGNEVVPDAAPGTVFNTRFGQCPQFFPAGKFPSVPAGPALRELCFSSFAILHSGHHKTPVFVAQRLNRQMLVAGQKIRRTDRFFAESRLPPAERANLVDYRGSGYSRGHMAPAGDMHSDEAIAQSFSLANMVPQDQQHNAGAWNRIESDTRKYIMRAKGDVYVFTGPIHGGRPERIGPGRVAVPTHLFKLVYDATTGRSWVHWQANSPQATAGPPIRYDEFVRRTGLSLLP